MSCAVPPATWGKHSTNIASSPTSLSQSMMLLLGLEGSILAQAILFKIGSTVDLVTFWLGVVNFAGVGLIAMFGPSMRGALGGMSIKLPLVWSQVYAVTVSVIMAWLLSHFPAWVSWTLLVMLGFWDLFAVLTPCGPLKWMIKFASQGAELALVQLVQLVHLVQLDFEQPFFLLLKCIYMRVQGGGERERGRRGLRGVWVCASWLEHMTYTEQRSKKGVLHSSQHSGIPPSSFITHPSSLILPFPSLFPLTLCPSPPV